MHALVIPAVRRKVAVKPEFSWSFSALGITTILTMVDLLVRLKSCRGGNMTSLLQTTNGRALRIKQEVANMAKLAKSLVQKEQERSWKFPRGA